MSRADDQEANRGLGAETEAINNGNTSGRPGDLGTSLQFLCSNESQVPLS